MKTEDKERAQSLHKNSIVIDGLNFIQDLSVPGVAADYLLGRYGDELRRSGMTAINLSVCPPSASPVQFLKGISALRELIDQHGDRYILVKTARDIEQAKREGKVGIIMGSQGESQIGEYLQLLRIYKELGERIIQPVYYRQSQFGEGCCERTNGGLSNLGFAFVEEMNRLHMAIDMSHCGYQVTMDAIKHSRAPVLITHSGARALVDHPRNKSDEQIKALAEKGGVIGVTSFSPFCEVRKGFHPTMEDFMAIMDYVVKLVGPDHVGLALDASFENRDSYNLWAKNSPEIARGCPWGKRNIFCDKDGWVDVTVWQKFTEWMVAHGYSDETIQKILGGNFFRVLKEIWGNS